MPDQIPDVTAALVTAIDSLVARLAQPPTELWTREQLADALAISLRSLGELEASGAIGPEPLRLGGSPRLVRYRVDSVRAWLAAGAPHRSRWVAIEAAMKSQRRAG